MAKIIKYMLFQSRINHGTEEEPKWEDLVRPKEVPCTADNLSANEEIAKKEAYKGEYEIIDDGIEEITQPTWQDRIEAQVTYNSMMLGTLIEEV